MPIHYKIDILKALKSKGYNTSVLRKEKIFGEATIQKIRRGEIVTAKNLVIICELLECQPADILVYQQED